LEASKRPRRRAAGRARKGIVILLFTDVVGSSEVLDRLGDDAADAARRRHFRLLRHAVNANRGDVVKSLGDGLMATFDSALDAVSCAIEMQRAVHADGVASMRVGLHAGEPIRDRNDYFGSAVVIAKRLCDSAHGGEIVASELVRSLVEPSGRFRFAIGDMIALKGVAAPVSTSKVVWEPAEAEAGRLEDGEDEGQRSPRTGPWVAAALALAAVTVGVAIALPDGGEKGERASVAGTDGAIYPEPVLELDDIGWVNQGNGTVVVTGELGCSEVVEARLSGSVETQEPVRVRESFHERVTCGESKGWKVVFPGRFHAGEAAIDATLSTLGETRRSVSQTDNLTLRACTRFGDLGNDELRGRTEEDSLCGLAGNDYIDGGKGNDKLRGYHGNDSLFGDFGDDVLTGGFGRDRLRGGRGDDRLIGDFDRDVLDGGPGMDTCIGGKGRDRISCERETRRA
jgi:class 3 adenylate cyclase